MDARKTTMTRLITRLIKRTVFLVSALRVARMGPMQTMLTSLLGQAGIPAEPLADGPEWREAMRRSKWVTLSLMAALVGLAMHSGFVAAAEVGPTARGAIIGQTLRERFERDAAAKTIVDIIVNSFTGCDYFFKGDAQKIEQCVLAAFLHGCSPDPKNRHWKECKEISNRLRELGFLEIPKYTCATKENGDQLCLISPTTISSGDLLRISIDIGDLNGAAVDSVGVTVQVSTAFGAELSQPYRDPQNPGDVALTWTGGPYDWIGTAPPGSISGAALAQPLFAIGNVPADESVTVTAHVDYPDDRWWESLDVSTIVEVLSETAVTPSLTSQ